MIRVRHSQHKVPVRSARRRYGWGPAISILVCMTALTACGTDVKGLLKLDSRLVIEADKAAAAAEAVDPDLTNRLYEAEDEKRSACQTIYASISELMQRDPTYGEQLASDIGLFLAFFFPFDEVERCAKAQAAYRDAIDDLKQRLGDAAPQG